jgi:hypothetical protein
MPNPIVVVPFPPSSPPSSSAAVAYELEMQRRNTDAYIATDPTDVVFTVNTAASDGEGGTIWGATGTLGAQRVRIVTGASSSGSVVAERRTVDGEVVLPEVMLIMEWDAAVEMGWTFMHDGDTYEVVFVNDDSRYEKLVEVVKRG